MKKNIFFTFLLEFITLVNISAQTNWDNPSFGEIFIFMNDSISNLEDVRSLNNSNYINTNEVDLFSLDYQPFDFYKYNCSLDNSVCEYYCFNKIQNWCQNFIVRKKASINLVTGIFFDYNLKYGTNTKGFFLFLKGKEWLYVETCCSPPGISSLNQIKSIMFLDENLYPVKKLNYCNQNLVSKSKIKKEDKTLIEEIYSLSSQDHKLKNLPQITIEEIYNLFVFQEDNQRVNSSEIKVFFSDTLPIWIQGNNKIEHCSPSIWRKDGN